MLSNRNILGQLSEEHLGKLPIRAVLYEVLSVNPGKVYQHANLRLHPRPNETKFLEVVVGQGWAQESVFYKALQVIFKCPAKRCIGR